MRGVVQLRFEFSDQQRAQRRTCVDCGMDISDRRGNAKRCKQCSHKRRRSISNAANKRLRERSRKSLGMLSREEKRINTCTVIGCDKPHIARGLCCMHYAREMYGSKPVTRNRGLQCSFTPCDRKAKSRGLCGAHYEAQRKGRPLRSLAPLARRHIVQFSGKPSRYHPHTYTKSCSECATAFTTAFNKQGYCSKACQQIRNSRARRKPPQTLVCTLCGSEFRRAYVRARNFCSELCQLKDERERAKTRPKKKYTYAPQLCAIEGCRSQRNRKDLCRLHSKLSQLGPEKYYSAKHVRRPIGAVRLNSTGYAAIKVAVDRWVMHHKYVMEQRLGRELVIGEEVHHVNGDKADNRIENLELWSSSQPPGQRISDKLTWARELIAEYGDPMAQELLGSSDAAKRQSLL